MIRHPWLVAAGGLLMAVPGLSAQSCPAPGAPAADETGAMAHVRYLADDALEGREVASPGAHCAGDYIAAHFQALGLEPAGDGGTYFESFPVRVGSSLGTGNVLGISGNTWVLGKGWTPFGFSATADVDGPLTYQGAGVERPSGEDVDSAALNRFAGQVVVLEAVGADETPGTFSTDPHLKASAAQSLGAAGVILLLSDGEALPSPDAERRPYLRVPVAAVGGDAAEAVRRAARAGEVVHMVTVVEPRTAQGRNVAALLPGSDPALAAEVVVLGAHYDHLGHGGEGSLAPDSHEVHNGADDNASGTGALLEAARIMSQGPRPRRPVLFLSFTGEERGLLGSAWYVEHPTVSLDSAVAMINMDMVGRLRDNTLTVYGMGTAQEWDGLVAEVNQAQAQPFQLSLLPDGFGPSDHSSFYGRGIPVLHFFTNTHAQYHRPEDDWQLINGPGLERVAEFAAAVAGRLAGTPERVAASLTPVAGAGQPQASGESSGRGYGPYFGSIPDMSPQDYGVRLSGVREDSPAARAGLEAGDILIRFGGEEVADLYGFTYALRDRKPGDRVEVVVLRDGQRITMYAVLGERR